MTIPIPTPGGSCQWESSSEDLLHGMEKDGLIDLRQDSQGVR